MQWVSKGVVCVILSLELGKQKGELTDITLSPKIFKDKLSLMHLETWIYYILKKKVFLEKLYQCDFGLSSIRSGYLCHFLCEDIPNMGPWV